MTRHPPCDDVVVLDDQDLGHPSTGFWRPGNLARAAKRLPNGDQVVNGRASDARTFC